MAMTEGIDRSSTVVVFITRNYLRKAAGRASLPLPPTSLQDSQPIGSQSPMAAHPMLAYAEGPRGLNDNCMAEFAYSANRRGAERLVAVVMEPRCLDTTDWHGTVGLRLGSHLYVDLTRDDGMEAKVEELAQEILRCAGDEAAPLVQHGSSKGKRSRVTGESASAESIPETGSGPSREFPIVSHSSAGVELDGV